MAKSAAVNIEVRWRETGTTQWSEIQTCSPAAQIVVEGLDRTKTYDFEWRGVSACGARSAWGSTSHTLPGVGPGNVTLAELKQESEDAATDAAAALAELSEIASDNVLSPVEKMTVTRDYSVIITEQAGIDAQAVAFGVTTQKTAYDGKVSALSDYLATLTDPTDWDDVSGNTTIVGSTFRTRFADVYTSRQTLLNAIYAAAKAKADAAQTSADTAVGQVTQLPVINGAFDMTPVGYGWTADAGSGWSVDTAGHSPIGTSNSATHSGGTGAATGAYRNNGLSACQQGQTYKAQALIRADGANGTCYVFISWVDAAGSEVSTSVPSATNAYGQSNYVTGTTAGQGSYVVGQCPAGAVGARTCLAVSGHTAGNYYVDNVVCTQHPASVDEVPDGSTYARTQAFMLQNGVVVPNGNGDNLVPNHSFATNDAGLPANTYRSAGQDICDNWYIGTLDSAYLGVNYESSSNRVLVRLLSGVTVPANTTITASIAGRRKIPLTPGETLYVAATLARSYNQTYPSTPTISIFAGLHVYNADGGVVGNYGASADKSLTSQTVKYATITLPSTASYAIPYLLIKHTTAAFAFDTSDGLYADIRCFDLQVVRQVALEQAGSGRRLGDLRNQVMVGVGNFGAGWNGGSISYSASSTSATISVTASSMQVGATSVSYSASSTTVSGSAGLTRTYYLYYDDDDYTGGSKTLNATTSQITSLAANGRVLVGSVSVTFPTSGTGTGGGGLECPDENAWVLRADPTGQVADWVVRAADIRPGDYLRLTDGRAGRVSQSRRVASPRVQVIDALGRSFTGSPSAPMLLWSGADCLRADALDHHWLHLRRGEQVEASPVARVVPLPAGHVQHITCENACFYAGDHPDALFGHHNRKAGALP